MLNKIHITCAEFHAVQGNVTPVCMGTHTLSSPMLKHKCVPYLCYQSWCPLWYRLLICC